MSRAMVLLSGGIDSAVALAWARREGHELTALSVDYHQRPAREREAARAICGRAGGRLIEVALPFLKEAVDLRRDGYPVPGSRDAPEGWVPVRNLVFYAIAAYYAKALGVEVVVGGHIGSDPQSFPDASRSFFEALEKLVAQSGREGQRLTFALPLSALSKAQVVGLGLELEAELALTWSCYGDGERPCRACASCAERARAFAELGLVDPAVR